MRIRKGRICAFSASDKRRKLAVTLPAITVSAAGALSDAPAGRRPAWFSLDGARDAAVVRGDSLAVGAVVDGPAIIEEATTTLVLPPGTRARLGAADSYMVTFSA